MLDFQLYGLQPAGHHLTNLLLHAANSVLLFLVLRQLTGRLWRSALAAALFALHPLRVESVVWIAERKDVLSTFFWMLTVGAFVRYTQETNVPGSRRHLFYALALVFFTLGLLAKPMLVTLPCVLLLLDFWPLRRLQAAPRFFAGLITEKIPFFILALFFSVMTVVAQDRGGAVKSFSQYSMGQRLANVPVSYVRYLSRIFWPENLAIFYPFQSWHPGQVLGAVALLASISACAFWRWRTQPYLAVGWLWFLGTLMPVIGLLQSGDQGMADRFSYVPSIGILLMVIWGLYDWAAGRPSYLKILAGGGALAVLACALLTSWQIRWWRSDIALFSHAAEVTDKNQLAFYNLGCAVLATGDYPRAIKCFEQSLIGEANGRGWPGLSSAYNDLGYSLLHIGQVAKAVSCFDSALALRPAYADVYYNLGCAFLTNGQPDVAVECLQKAIALDSNVVAINYTLAEALVDVGRPADAQRYLEKTLQLRPSHALAHYRLAGIAAREGRMAEAIAHYNEALALNPKLTEAARELARLKRPAPAEEKGAQP
jgi:tetratricopeptide (TPR) repeat protein